MNTKMGHTWALVLAAGEGSRLRSVTTTRAGVAIPKQFCSLQGGLSLLHEALQRAEAVAAPEHICAIVAQEHRRWWEGSLGAVPAANIIVQPKNRGTANGILLPLLHILERDPDARIVLLPADHHVRDEAVLAQSLRSAVSRLKTYKREIILLGIAPDEIDAELGYIVPGKADAYGIRRVELFVEKPSVQRASELIFEGALWNAFIVVASARALLEMFTRRFPEIVAEMQAVVAHDCADPQQPIAAAHVYESLPDIDFSKHVVPGFEESLRVVAVPSCGWSDLGTPKRVADTLRRTTDYRGAAREISFPLRGHLNLAEQCFRIG